MHWPSETVIDFVQQMRDLGAAEIEVGEVRVVFAPSPAMEASVDELLGRDDREPTDEERVREREALLYAHADG